MNIMKAEEYKFPVLKESDAMFSADTAPEWAEGDCCHRCRVQFSLVQRKVTRTTLKYYFRNLYRDRFCLFVENQSLGYKAPKVLEPEYLLY